MQTAEASALTALEQLEKDFITFVVYHTRSLTEAITYLKMKLGAFRARRRKYQIPKPPPHHYEGPVLSQDEMMAAFYASHAPSAPVLTPAELVRKLKVTLALPDGPNLTVPPEAVRVEGLRATKEKS